MRNVKENPMRAATFDQTAEIVRPFLWVAGLAFSTGLPATRDNSDLDEYFIGAWEASQEAVYNCLVAATPGEMSCARPAVSFAVLVSAVRPSKPALGRRSASRRKSASSRRP